MNIFEFNQKMADYSLFRTSDLRLVFGDEFDRSFLNNLKNWEKRGHLIRLRKGLYLLGSERFSVEPMMVASKIYEPSYVSLETALGYYGIIPEAVFTTTSVTTRKTKNFENELGRFSFQKIKRGAFGGYKTILRKELGISFNLAEPEKALVDFLYLNSHLFDGKKEAFKSYRFSEEFKYNKEKLLYYTQSFKSKKLNFLINNFIQFYAS